MMSETYYEKLERESCERLELLLAKPFEASPRDNGVTYDSDEFDPWELFPCLYGSYSGDFDKCALQVLQEIKDKTFIRDDLAAHMFREMLCKSGFCEYGTSPRVCFHTKRFGEMLPTLIKKWREWSFLNWNVDVCAEIYGT